MCVSRGSCRSRATLSHETALGALVIIIGWFCFENPNQPPPNLKLTEKLAKMDLVGAALFIASMTCLFIALQRGGTQYSWSNVAAWGWLLGFALTLIIFAALQIRLRDKYNNLSSSFSMHNR